MTGSERALPETPRAVEGGVRLLRVALLGGASLLLASAAHVVGGGRLPGPGVLVVAGVVLGLAALLLTARRYRLPLVLTVLTVEQGLLHVLFDASSMLGSSCPTAHALGAHVMSAPHLPSCASDPVGATGAAMSVTAGVPLVHGASMWVLHAVATVLTAVLLARGEAWLWRVAHRLVVVAHAAPAGWPSTGATAPAAVPSPGFGGRRAFRAVPRGPPLLAVVLV